MTRFRSAASVAAAAFLVAVGGASVWASEANPSATGKLAFTLEQMNCMSSDSSNQIPCAEKARA